jgi:type IV pilus assembly protein PilM
MGFDWKKALKPEQLDVLGMDIGSEQVKLVELRKAGSGYTVTSASVTAIADGGEDNAEEKTAVAQAITNCVRSAEPRTRLAVCGVSGPDVAVRGFKFPALPKDEIEGAVLLEAAQVCPFNMDEGVVDYQLIPNGDDSLRGVMVAATHKLIKRKTRLAAGAELTCVLMDVDGLALLNCFSQLESSDDRKDKGPGTTAILNVGSRYTTLAIRGSEDLPFIRDIAYAGSDIIELIANSSGQPKETVRDALFGGKAGTTQVDLFENMQAACQKLAVDVAETLRYYNAQEKQRAVDKIHVCGGFSLADGFVRVLNDRLPAEVVLWNPFDQMPCTAGPGCERLLSRKGPALAVAAGFAMRSI